MKKSFFKICLIAFLVFWQTASSYIYQIRYYYDPITKKTIFMLSDQHIMGNRKQNLEQFEKFKKICEQLKKKEMTSQVLFEDMFAYTLKYSIQSETYCEKVSNKDRCYNMNFVLYDVASNLDYLQILKCSINGAERGESTWLIDLWPFAVKNESLFITYKSIDSRLISNLRTLNIEGSERLQEILFVSNLKNLMLLKNKFYSDLIGEKLRQRLKKILEEMRDEEFLQKVTECNGCKEKINELVDVEFSHGTFFSRALEHEALLHMCFEHDFKYTFLLVGGAHADYLSQYMESLGFELKETVGISSKEALTLESTLPDDLKQKIDDAFDEMGKLID